MSGPAAGDQGWQVRGGKPTVAVLGLGLIGGSLARDLAAVGCRVIGGDSDMRATDAARHEGILRDVVPVRDPSSWAATLADVDVVVLAVPGDALPALLAGLTGALASGAVVTDTAGTKRGPLAAAAGTGLGRRFVGSHPMAGDHRSGWGASRVGLFKGATSWICPGDADPAAVSAVESLWALVGARTRRADALAHDRIMAWASHLPQVAASALGATLGAAGLDEGDLGPGGRDTTRIAGSSPGLWSGLLLDNADMVEPALLALERDLAALRRALHDGDREHLRTILDRGRQWAEGSGPEGPPAGTAPRDEG